MKLIIILDDSFEKKMTSGIIEEHCIVCQCIDQRPYVTIIYFAVSRIEYIRVVKSIVQDIGSRASIHLAWGSSSFHARLFPQ